MTTCPIQRGKSVVFEGLLGYSTRPLSLVTANPITLSDKCGRPSADHLCVHGVVDLPTPAVGL